MASKTTVATNARRRILFAQASAAALLLLGSQQAAAQHYEGGDWKVTGYRTGDGNWFALSPAPIACQGGSNYGEHIRIPDGTPNHAAIIAALQTAYITGAKISGLWFKRNGPCSDSDALEVFMIRMAGR